MSDSKYDSVFEAVLRAIGPLRKRREVKLDLPKLLALPPGRQVMKVRSLRQMQSAEVADALRKASDEQRFAEPKLALQLARLAVHAARAAIASGHAADPGRAAIELDVLAESLATLANAHRVVGDTKKAAAYFKEAVVVAHRGSGDPLIQTKIEWLSAVLLADRGQLDQALFLYLHCEDVYERLDERELATVVRICIGQIHLRKGQSEKTLHLASRCLGEIVPSREPQVAHSAILLIALAHLDLGQPNKARSYAQTLQLTCTQMGDEAFEIRGEWVEARALLAMGWWKEGVEGLTQAREKLQEVGALANAAHAHLELALAHADACQWEEAHAIARQAFGTLAAAGLEGKALLALRTAARAADGQELSCKVLRQAIGQVNANS